MEVSLRHLARPLRHRVRGDVQLPRELPQGRGQELPVAGRGRPVGPAAPDGEDLDLRPGVARQRPALLDRERGEEHHRAEQRHGVAGPRQQPHQLRIQRDARALAEAGEDEAVPVQLVLLQLRSQRLHQRTAEQLHVVQGVQVLVLERRPAALVPRAVGDLVTLEVEIPERLAGGVLGPGHIDHHGILAVLGHLLEGPVVHHGVVADEGYHQARAGSIADLLADSQGLLGVHGGNARIREEKVEPLHLELLPLLSLSPLPILLRLLHGLPLLLRLLVLGVALVLLLEGREDQHNLRVLRSIGRA
mmetsp:Transcript_91062/g.254374  ORF Transcript_91062/g.254374 Transcript_91062/m.254374 type:complete len:304 (-) Transcript_91062:160-1071(-)